MNKNEKTLTALLGVAIVILILLYLNSRVAARINAPLQPIPEIQSPNVTIWQSQIPSLTIDLGNYTPSISEIYYANGSCMCQG